MPTDPDADLAAALAGKYLTLRLAGTDYGIRITAREIIGMLEVTKVPRTPDFVRGILNLRGKITPIVDLRRVLDLPPAEDTELTRIIVVEVGGKDTGVVVDYVEEVLDFVAADIVESPEFGPDVDTRFVLGVAKGKDKVTLLLDIAAALTQGQRAALTRLADAA